MRRGLCVLAALFACSAPEEGAVFEPFPEDGTIARLELELDRAALDSLKAHPRDWVEGALIYAGRRYDRIALRVKGHRSLRSIDQKPAFKIHFSKLVEERRFFGLEKLTLNNMVEDPTMEREVLAYRVHRALGVRVPRLRYAEVLINGEHYGLYLMVEPIDDSFLLARGKKGDSIYEGEYGCDLHADDVDGFDKDAGGESREDLARLASIAEGSAWELLYSARAPIDRKRVLGFLAASAIIGDFDGYRQGHNYFLHHDLKREKWSLIPWGLDRTFTSSLGLFDMGGALAVKCFEDPRCRSEYVQTLEEGAELFEALDLPSLAEELDRSIDRAAKTDPRKPYKVIEMRVAHRTLLEFLRRRPAEVRRALDSPPVERPVTCRPLEGEGARFLLCDTPMSWERAERHCAELGGTLARIDSKAQSKRIHRAARARRKSRWWIGFNDRRMEDVFRWADGGAVTFAYWGRGEPDNYGCNQDCVALSEGKGGHWHDNHCAQRLPFVCRVE